MERLDTSPLFLPEEGEGRRQYSGYGAVGGTDGDSRSFTGSTASAGSQEEFRELPPGIVGLKFCYARKYIKI